jgi:hypothetical protein
VGVPRTAAQVLSGAVPPLAEFFHDRPETGSGTVLAERLRPGETVLLVPALPGTGGTGKTQLAVGFAHAMWSAREIDLLVWIHAGSRPAVLAGYARAAAGVELVSPSEAEGAPEASARRFLAWLERTERRWAVVLDGIASPADVDGLWPYGPAGQVVATSRLREQDLVPEPVAGVTTHAVAGFSRREALGYLNARLTDFPDQRIEAIDLAEDIRGLPIALDQAAAVVTVTGHTCRDYRAEFAERTAATAGTPVDGCPPALLATWSLAVEQAHELAPAALSWPALVFAAALDTGGIPGSVLTAPAARAYILGQADADPAGDELQTVRAAYANLERLGLLSLDNASPTHTVWLHSVVRAAVRAYLAPGRAEQVADAAGAALGEAWPDDGSFDPLLAQALRDCAGALREFAGGA